MARKKGMRWRLVGRPGGNLSLVLVDIKMSCMDGRGAFRRMIRFAGKLGHSPVVILSSSRGARDLAHSRGPGVDTCVVKPGDVLHCLHVVQMPGPFRGVLSEPPNTYG